eukprot:5009676-Amphidinium_carterae.1
MKNEKNGKCPGEALGCAGAQLEGVDSRNAPPFVPYQEAGTALWAEWGENGALHSAGAQVAGRLPWHTDRGSAGEPSWLCPEARRWSGVHLSTLATVKKPSFPWCLCP